MRALYRAARRKVKESKMLNRYAMRLALQKRRHLGSSLVSLHVGVK